MARVQNNQVILSLDEQGVLRGFRDNEQWGEAYQYVAGLLRDIEEQGDEAQGNIDPVLLDGLPAQYESVVLWFEGAALVNLAEQPDDSAFADLIRFYSSRQTELHFGSERDPFGIEMQAASDRVSQNAVDSILSNSGAIPLIGDIAQADATGVGQVLFQLDQQDTAFRRNAAWSGTVLFSLLGNDQTGLLLRDRNNTEESFNNLEDLRNLLFAVDAFNYGIQQAVSGFSFIDNWGDLFPTGVETFFSANNPVDLGVSFTRGLATNNYEDFLLEATSGGSAESALSFVVRQDRNRIVESLSELLGLGDMPVTEANFLARAQSLFSTIETNNLLSLSITRLDQLSSESLLANAIDSIEYRYALINANPFIIQNSQGIYDAINASGEYDLENYTSEYLQDRAEYVSALFTFNANNGSPSNTSPDISTLQRYEDVELGVALVTFESSTTGETVVISESQARTLGVDLDDFPVVRFGGDASENLVGGDSSDSLYGGAGNDTLNGSEGNDYLEGGEGADTYRFNYGDGRDVVVDGSSGNRLLIEHQAGAGAVAVSRISLLEGLDNVYAEFTASGQRVNNTTYTLVDAATEVDDDNSFYHLVAA